MCNDKSPKKWGKKNKNTIIFANLQWRIIELRKYPKDYLLLCTCPGTIMMKVNTILHYKGLNLQSVR